MHVLPVYAALSHSSMLGSAFAPCARGGPCARATKDFKHDEFLEQPGKAGD